MGGACGSLRLRELAVPESWDVGCLYYWVGVAFHDPEAAQLKVDLAVDLLEKALRYRENALGKPHFSRGRIPCMLHFSWQRRSSTRVNWTGY